MTITDAVAVAGVLVQSLALTGLYLLQKQVLDARTGIVSQLINELVKEFVTYEPTIDKLTRKSVNAETDNPVIGHESDSEAIAKLTAICAFFEKISHFKELGTLSLSRIDRIFGFRFFIVMHNRLVLEEVITPKLAFWKDLIVLHRELIELRTARNSEIPSWDQPHVQQWYNDVRNK